MSTSPTPATAQFELPPEAQVMNIVSGAWISAAVYVTAKLGIADLLSDGPRSVEFLSVATSTHTRSLYRILRATATVGIFSEGENHMFSNTPLSETLRSDHPRSTRPMTIWINEPEHWNVYGELMHSVKTGEPAWNKVHGEPIFTYLFGTNPELGRIFNEAMTSFTNQTSGPLLEAYDFSGAEVIADIGGGVGHLLGAVLARNPGPRGILFDMPEVLEGAPAMLESYGVTDRVKIVSGDFTTEVPVEADVYMLKHIIHDWYDEKNRTILGNVRASMKDGARILIMENVVPEGNDPHFAKILDLEMLTAPGGMERTEKEFAELIEASGLKMTQMLATAGGMNIIEAVKA